MNGLVQIRKVARQGTGHTPSRSVPEYWKPEECTIPWLTLADVWQLRDGSASTILETAERVSPLGIARSSAVVHPAGTVALSRTASVGFACVLGVDMATSQDFVTWTPGSRLLSRYLLWALRGLRDDILGRMQGSTHQTIYMPDLKQISIPLHPVEEQQRIADYLDSETARIDELIAEQRDLIDLLWEKRRAAVFDAVTGRSEHGERVSGVPWTDSIPKDWDAVKLTAVARLGSGHTPARSRPELWEDCTIPWVTTGEVWQIRSDEKEVLTQTREMISAAGVAASSAVVHPAGTVVLCRTAASAGYSAIMGTEMATSQDFATWTCGSRLDPQFLLYCLRAMRRDLLERLAMGSTHRTIYMPEIKGLIIPLPSVQRQAEIVGELSSELTSLDQTRLELDQQIVLLEERRQALITHAVTQGIDGLPGVA